MNRNGSTCRTRKIAGSFLLTRAVQHPNVDEAFRCRQGDRL